MIYGFLGPLGALIRGFEYAKLHSKIQANLGRLL